MLHGPLLGKIMAFALPLAVTSVLQQLFNSVDSAVAGQLVGNDALAGIGATGPLVNLLVSLFVGLSVGANVVIASGIALKEERKLADAVHTVMAVALVSGAFLVVLGFFVSEPALRLISTPESIIGIGTVYLQVYFCSMPFMMVYNFGSAILRSKGDSQRPLYALAVACFLNLVLDLLFVAVCHWDVVGIALGTVLSYAVAAFIIAYLLMHEAGALRFDPRKLHIVREPLMVVLKIGVPAGVQGAVFAISNLIIQGAINGFGAEAIAGSAAGINYECFTYFVTASFAQAAVTFTSQNYAARNMRRCRRIWGICMACSFALDICVSVVFVAFGEFWLGLFTGNAAAISFGMIRMWNVELLECLPSSYEVSAGSLRGMQWSTLPAIITIFGTCILRVLWVFFVFPLVGTYEMLIYIFPITWVVTGIAMILAYLLVRNRLEKREDGLRSQCRPKVRTGRTQAA
ncbi:MAG: MATE family efflux transporter [Eggerthellaceae bacterium]|jgi:putative MATE family efflux protein